ncbi:MAG: HEPN domain-containing protein [Chloroflexi bacterium]|nr:HEPN domain-containing protein [Chloroflexota bacterium]
MALKHRLVSIFDVFSRRQPPQDSRYRSDQLSTQLRNRILLLYRDVVSGEWPSQYMWSGQRGSAHAFWKEMHNSLQHLYGRPQLSNQTGLNEIDDISAFLNECDAKCFFDFIELSFKLTITYKAIGDGDDLVESLNEIFRVEDAPYQLTPFYRVEEPQPGYSGTLRPSGGTVIRTEAYPKVIRTDEDAAHVYSIAPALSVLSAGHFKEANMRFREALDDYRNGDYDDCLTKCGTSLESVTKALCDRNKWAYNEHDNLSRVLRTAIGESNLDSFYESPLMLVATIRNKLSSSHGAGTTIRSVERHVAQYAVNSTAAAILLLVHECDK